ncbi:TetR/AcrR family transcriptional regulator C-terminal domain-containing protein [Actinoalloteichus fjordicus]|uniref:TetR/AcrR family transcriptional regulator C-terminal domain-containing protein n=1 Tax=Actinoalloteichus TaxID=65496 RepID=UPI00384C58DC
MSGGGAYPEFARRLRDAQDVDADRRFDFGLACLLDGVAARASAARDAAGPPA